MFRFVLVLGYWYLNISVFQLWCCYGFTVCTKQTLRIYCKVSQTCLFTPGVFYSHLNIIDLFRRVRKIIYSKLKHTSPRSRYTSVRLEPRASLCCTGVTSRIHYWRHWDIVRRLMTLTKRLFSRCSYYIHTMSTATTVVSVHIATCVPSACTHHNRKYITPCTRIILVACLYFKV